MSIWGGGHTKCLQANYDGDMFLLASLSSRYLYHLGYILFKGNNTIAKITNNYFITSL